MSIKRLSDEQFTSWHEARVAKAVDELEEQGYEVHEIEEIKRPLFGFDVMFAGNITDIHYSRPEKKKDE